MNTALMFVLIVTAVLVAGAVGYRIRLGAARHRRRVEDEKGTGNLALRRRFYGLVIRDLGKIEHVTTAEKLRYRVPWPVLHRGEWSLTRYLGYMWIRVQGRRPRRGERPLEAHDEQVGWAFTRWGATRKMCSTPPITTEKAWQPVRVPTRVRNEAGSISDMLLWLFILAVVGMVAPSVFASMSPGDMLDWAIDKLQELLRHLAQSLD